MRKLLSIMLTISMICICFLAACNQQTDVGQDTGQNQTQQNEQSEQSEQTQEIVIRVESNGSPADTTRSTNIEDAAQELNEKLKQRGDNRRVTVEYSHDSTGDDKGFVKKFFLGWEGGNAPDIAATSHCNVPYFAEGNYALQLDDYIEKSEYKENLDQIYPHLWEAVKFDGKIYAVPQDVEVRPLYYRKDALRELGWSEQEIEDLPQKIESGEFTLTDMVQVAKQAMQQGVVEWGIYHRPNDGPFFPMMLNCFGVEMCDQDEQKIVLDKSGIKKALEFFNDICQVSKVTPDGMTSMEWRGIHQNFVEGDVLFWFGGTWHWAEYQTVDYHSELGQLTEDYMFENIGYALVPAAQKGGQPVTMSHPMVYIINSKTEHPDIAFELVAIASKPEYNLKHALESGHLGISPEVVEMPEYKDNKFFDSVSYMLDYTTTQPNHVDWNSFRENLYKAVQSVEMNKQTPEQAVDWMEKQLSNELGEDIIVKE